MILLDAMSTFCPQSDMAEKDTVYRFLLDEQLVARPRMPIVVPGATVAVPVVILTLALAQPDPPDGAETTGWAAKSIANDTRQTAGIRNFMSGPPSMDCGDRRVDLDSRFDPSTGKSKDGATQSAGRNRLRAEDLRRSAQNRAWSWRLAFGIKKF